jgi:hypothetical protein
LLEKEAGSSYTAALVSPFMDTTGKCVTLFYKFQGDANGKILIISTKEDLTGTVLRKVS